MPRSPRRALAINAWTDAAKELMASLESGGAREAGARWIAERLALTLQAALLVRHAPAAIADAFCETRLAGDWGRSFGTLPSAADPAGILRRMGGDLQ